MEYYGVMPKRKLYIKIGIIIFSVYTIYNSVVNYNLFYLLFGVVTILATLSERKHVISKRGVDILYVVCGMQFHNIWNWEDIDTIHIDSNNSKPNIELHIGKDIIARRIIFSKMDADEILKLAKRINSRIYIAGINTNK